MPSYKDVYQSGSTYLKCADLQNKKVPVMIEKAELEEVGQDKKQMVVLYFSKVGGDIFPADRCFPLNVTNAQMMETLTQTDDYDKWFNCKIKLYPSKTDFKGQQVDCIRIEPPAPQEVPEDEVPF